MSYLMHIYKGIVYFITSPEWVSAFGTIFAAIVALLLGVRKNKINIMPFLYENEGKIFLSFRNFSFTYAGLIWCKWSKTIANPSNRVLDLQQCGSIEKHDAPYSSDPIIIHTDVNDREIKFVDGFKKNYFFIVFEDVVTHRKFKVKGMIKDDQWVIDNKPFTRARAYLKRKQASS